MDHHECTRHGVDVLSTLPPELLGEIFMRCAVANPDAPVLLRTVSRVFREVVDSTPRVWERLSLSLALGQGQMGAFGSDDGRARGEDKSKAKAELWFRRSGGCMVSVKIDVLGGSGSGRSTPRVRGSGWNTPKGGLGDLDADGALGVLRGYMGRVKELEICAPSEVDARKVLGGVYGGEFGWDATAVLRSMAPSFAPSPSLPLDSPISPSSSASFVTPLPSLESLSIKISSTTPPSLRLSSSHMRLPFLPKLKKLRLTNHTVENFLAAADLGELRSLAISCPIRFAPLDVMKVVRILGRAKALEELEIEARMVEGVVVPPTIGGVDERGDDDGQGNLVHLPSLTRLSLRINAVPAFLSHLLLPNLDTLHIEDLNGKRAGAARETAEVMKQLLVRMEVPNEERVGRGLRVLDLVGVDVSDDGLTPSSFSSDDATKEREREGGPWEWCFKRMMNLEEVAVGKTDPRPLLDILAPVTFDREPRSVGDDAGASSLISSHSIDALNVGSHLESMSLSSSSPTFSCDGPTTAAAVDDIHTVCPRLRRVCISTTSHTPVPAQTAHRFRTLRPHVHLDVDVVKDPFFQTIATGPVDFLSLYSDMGLASSAHTQGQAGGSANGKEGVSSSSSRSASRSKTRGFGPWLVLGSGGSA